MKKLLKKAFTLAELLIALAVVGVLVAILMPIIFSIMPDQNALMAKRAYYTTQTVISELINDDNCYPDQTYSTNPRTGFEDGYGYINCEKWGADEDTEDYINTEGDPLMKFATLFADKLDIKKGTLEVNSNNKGLSFTTKDGMVYNIFPVVENSVNKIGISVDVNGTSDPNCGQSIVSMGTAGTSSNLSNSISVSDACKNLTNGHDRFGIIVEYDGTITLDDGWASDAVEVNNSVSGESTGNQNTTVHPINNSNNENNNNNSSENNYDQCYMDNDKYYCHKIGTPNADAVPVTQEEYEKYIEENSSTEYNDNGSEPDPDTSSGY